MTVKEFKYWLKGYQESFELVGPYKQPRPTEWQYERIMRMLQHVDNDTEGKE